MTFPIFPNVPDVAGVPSLLRFPPSLSGAGTAVASIAGNLMNVTNLTSGTLFAGARLSATGIISGTSIVNQINGISGGIGQYAVSVAQTFAGSLSSAFTAPDTSVPDALTTDNPLASNQVTQGSPQWGLFNDSGNSVIVADQVNSLEYEQDWRISSFPVEQGAFASYDKIATPYMAKIRFISGGSKDKRESLLSSLDGIAGDLNKYTVATPETTLLTANVMRYSYSRQSTNGLGLLKVDVEVEEIRETGTSTLSNTKTPGGSDQVNDGTKQPQKPTSQQSSALFSGLSGAPDFDSVINP